MAEENSSWLRRAKFSHTVCHRLDTYRTSSFPIAPRPECDFGLKPNAASSTLVDQPSRRVKLDSIPRKFSSYSDNNPPNLTRGRSISPVSETVLSETFKEARSERKRFSTPYPSRKEKHKGIVDKVFHRDTHHSFPADSLPSSSSIPHHRFLSMKICGKSKTRKESSWAKYFHHEGGRVSAATEEWTVDLSKLLLGPRFASGAYSKLYHGIYKDEPVAVKMIMIPDDDENGAMAARLEKQFTSEVTLLSHLHHKHVIKLVAACRKLPVFCIITEYLEGGSLRAYLHKLERKTLPLEKIIAISLDIARGMEYVHSQGVIHRDLKPENILLDENFCLKIADFGIACEEAYFDSMADDPGTYRWMAPEMIKHKPYGRKVDVYSFGLILWELLTGTIPYEERSPIQAAFAVVNKNLRPAIPAHCPAALHALIEQCWGLHSEKRPEFWEIVKVLEQFESSLARDGTLHLVPTTSSCHDHKKGLVHWIHKLSHSHVNTGKQACGRQQAREVREWCL